MASQEGSKAGMSGEDTVSVCCPAPPFLRLHPALSPVWVTTNLTSMLSVQSDTVLQARLGGLGSSQAPQHHVHTSQAHGMHTASHHMVGHQQQQQQITMFGPHLAPITPSHPERSQVPFRQTACL